MDAARVEPFPAMDTYAAWRLGFRPSQSCRTSTARFSVLGVGAHGGAGQWVLVFTATTGARVADISRRGAPCYPRPLPLPAALGASRSSLPPRSLLPAPPPPPRRSPSAGFLLSAEVVRGPCCAAMRWPSEARAASQRTLGFPVEARGDPPRPVSASPRSPSWTCRTGLTDASSSTRTGAPYHQLTSLKEVRTLWIGNLQYWTDENYLYGCFAHTGEYICLEFLMKQSGPKLQDSDIFLNASSGFKLTEMVGDLAIGHSCFNLHQEGARRITPCDADSAGVAAK